MRYKVPAGTPATYYNCPCDINGEGNPELSEWIIGVTTQDAYFDFLSIPMMNDALTDGTIVFRLPLLGADKQIINNYRFFDKVIYHPTIRVKRSDCIELGDGQLNATSVVGNIYDSKGEEING